MVRFIERVFGGKEKQGSRILDKEGLIDHVEVQLGDSVIMLFDHRASWPPTPSFLKLYVEDAEEVMQRAENNGAEIITKLTFLFFGEKIGRIRDPWGNIWWIHQRVETLDAKEMERRMKDPSLMEAMSYVQNSLTNALNNKP